MCIFLQVSIVQQTDESTTASHDIESDEEATWELGESDHEGLPSSSEEISPSPQPLTNSDSDEDVHDSQGHYQDHGDEDKEDENRHMAAAEAEKDMEEDMMLAESSQDVQTVVVDSPRKKFPFRRRGRPTEPDYGSQEQPSSLPSKSVGHDNGYNDDDNSNEKSLPEQEKHQMKPSSKGDRGGNRVVYSQRVTDYSAYRPRPTNINAGVVAAAAASDTPNDLGKYNAEQDNGNGSADNDKTTTTTNGENRPKYPPRRRRPFSSLMRNRVQQDQEAGLGTNTETPIESESTNESNPPQSDETYGTSSVQKSPVLLHVPVEEAVHTQDELGNQRRPPSRLGRPRVNSFLRGRKKIADISAKPEQEEENLYPNNSYGVTPTLDNEEKNLQQQQEKLLESDSKATIGSADVSSGESSAKVYENSPTGKLEPFRPKIRPFARKNNPSSPSVDDSSQINQNEKASYGPESQGYDQNKSADDAQIINTNGVRIRKIPIRRVQPVQTEATGDDSSFNTPAPINKGRIVMRRPSSLVKISSPPEHPESPVVTGEQGEAPAEVEDTAKVEKVDVRNRLRGKRRRLSTAPPQVHVSAEANDESNVDTDKVESSDESKSPVLFPTSPSDRRRPDALRRRVRPLHRPVSSEKGHTDTIPSEMESSGWKQPATEDLAEATPPHQPTENPLRKIRKGMNRFPFLRNNSSSTNNYEQQPQQQQETASSDIPASSEENSATSTEVVKPATRLRLRVPAHRGNSRLAMQSATTEDAVVDEPQTTSEIPVTVTSTYARIRSNNRNNPRPVYKKRVKEVSASGEIETVTSMPAAEDSASPPNYSPFGDKNRFGVKTRFSKTKITPTQPAAEPSPSSEQQLPEEGQLTQLNQSSQDYNTNDERKRVSFKRRKMIKGKQQQQQQQQQEHLASEETQEVHRGQAESNPVVTEIAEHAGTTEETPVLQPDSDLFNPEQGQQKEEELSSPGNYAITDKVKILPGEAISLAPHMENIKKNINDDDGDSDGHKNDDDSDDYHKKEGDGVDDGTDEAESDKKDEKSSYASSIHDVDGDNYDMILNKDVRKTLGTHYTQPMHSAYQPHSGNVETATQFAYDSLVTHHNPSSQHVYFGTQDNMYHPHQQYYQQQQQQPDNHNQYYGQYYDSYTGHNVFDHSGDMNKEDHVSLSHFNGLSRETENGGILELGTPDYDPNPMSSYIYWHGEDGEDEEESRISVKFLSNKTNSGSKSSSVAEDAVSVSQKGIYNQVSQVDAASYPQSPVTPLNGQPEGTYSRPSSPNTHDDNDNGINIKKERNKRIRQKLRRPPSAYINNSAEAQAAPVPFTPSLPSPRPTYPGREALVQSVSHSVHSFPKNENPSSNPSAQPLEQFIHSKQVTPITERRNRTRIRIKLSTLPTTTTTTPKPVSGYDSVNDDDNAQYEHGGQASFSFPPFRKSELALITSTEETPTENQSYTYTPPQVFFKPSTLPTTTTTSTTTPPPPPTTRKPSKSHYIQNNNNNNDYYNQVSVSPLPVPVEKENVVKSVVHPGKFDTRKNRFKVSDLNKVGLQSTTASSTSSINSSSSPSSVSAGENPVTPVKPTQPRIKSPVDSNRKLPKFPTAPPIRNHLVATTPAPLIYSEDQNAKTVAPSTFTHEQPAYDHDYNGYHQQQQPVKQFPLEPDHNSVSIRITSEPTDVTNFDKSEYPEQPYVSPTGLRHQAEQDVNNGPNSIISSYVPPVNNFNVKNTAASASRNVDESNRGKYSERFKVPEKFNPQNPSLFVANDHGIENNGGDHAAISQSPAAFDVKVNTITEPQRGPHQQQQRQQQQQFHFQTHAYDNVHTNVNLDMTQERIPLNQYNNHAIFENEKPEIIPDIKINVEPVIYQNNNYDQSAEKEVPYDYYHAVRDPPPPPSHYYPPHANALTNSPFGPFPSTDHWSGIPSSNSPKLPEFFEQHREPVQQQPNDFRKPTSHHVSFDFNNEVRHPQTLQEQRPSIVSGMHELPESSHGAVIDDDEEEVMHFPPVPVTPTRVEFGTDFDGEEEPLKHQYSVSDMQGGQAHVVPPNEPTFIEHIRRPPLQYQNSVEFANQPVPPPPPMAPQQIQIQISAQQPSPGSPGNGQGQPLPHLPPDNFDIKIPTGNPMENPNGRLTDAQQNSIENVRHPQESNSGNVVPFGVSQNPISILPVRHDIKDGALIAPHFGAQPVNDAHKNAPHQHPQQHFFPPNQQLPHLPKQPEPQHQQYQPGPHVRHPLNHPQQHIFERPREPAPFQNSHVNPHNPLDHSNIIVQVDGRPHNAPVMSQVNAHATSHLNTVQKPLERPAGAHVFFEREPELHVATQPRPPHATPTHLDKLPNLPFGGHQLEVIRDAPKSPHQKPQLSPKQPHMKFPDTISQGFGDQQKPLTRPGQFGPPPVSPHNMPHYVPFTVNIGDKFKKNESEKQGLHHHRPPLRHPSMFQNPGKHGVGHSFGSFPAHPPRQVSHKNNFVKNKLWQF